MSVKFCPNCNRKTFSEYIHKFHSCGHVVCSGCSDAHMVNCWNNGREW